MRGEVLVVASNAIVARHERLSAESQTRYDWQHYVPLVLRMPGALLRNVAPFTDLPEPLQRSRRALLRNSGGDRAMAQVLALVPHAGLEAVLVAAELALEGAPPSGRTSSEHVLDVLNRLSAKEGGPEQVITTLRTSTPPLADTARNDGLREQEHAREAGHA